MSQNSKDYAPKTLSIMVSRDTNVAIEKLSKEFNISPDSVIECAIRKYVEDVGGYEAVNGDIRPVCSFNEYVHKEDVYLSHFHPLRVS